MGHSKVEIYAHIVWGTWKREAMITEQWQNRIYGCVRVEMERKGSQVVAIGGIADHMHVILRIHPKEAIAEAIRRAKGVASHMVNEHNTGIELTPLYRTVS